MSSSPPPLPSWAEVQAAAAEAEAAAASTCAAVIDTFAAVHHENARLAGAVRPALWLSFAAAAGRFPAAAVAANRFYAAVASVGGVALSANRQRALRALNGSTHGGRWVE